MADQKAPEDLIDHELYGAEWSNIENDFVYYQRNTAKSADVAAEYKFDDEKFFKVSDTEYHAIVSKETATRVDNRYGIIYEYDNTPHYFVIDSSDGGFVFEAAKDYVFDEGRYYFGLTIKDGAGAVDEAKHTVGAEVFFDTTKYNDGYTKKADTDATEYMVDSAKIPEESLKKTVIKDNFYEGFAEEYQVQNYGMKLGESFYYTTLSEVSAAGKGANFILDRNGHPVYRRVGNDGQTYLWVTEASAKESVDDEDLQKGYIKEGSFWYKKLDKFDDAKKADKAGTYFKISNNDLYALKGGKAVYLAKPVYDTGAAAELNKYATKKLADGWIDITDSSSYLIIKGYIGHDGSYYANYVQNNVATYFAGSLSKIAKKEVSESVARRLFDEDYSMATRDGKTVFYANKVVDLNKQSVLGFVPKEGYVRIEIDDIPTFFKKVDWATAFDTNRYGVMTSAANRKVYFFADEVDETVATERVEYNVTKDANKWVVPDGHAYKVVTAQEAIKYDATKYDLVFKGDRWYLKEK